MADSGTLESASAMITDVFKYRADRKRYYLAADEVANIRQDWTGKLNSLIPNQFHLPQRAPSDMIDLYYTEVRS